MKKIAFELSTMVGENFETYLPQLARNFISEDTEFPDL